jgi:hypothetical protein
MIADYYLEEFSKECSYGEEVLVNPKDILFIPVKGNLKATIESGFNVKEERRLLKFLFSDADEAIEIFSALSFNNDLSEKERLKLKEFLLNRKEDDGIHITQGAVFICGYK